MNLKKLRQRGEVLTTVIVVVAMGMVFTTSAIFLLINNAQASLSFERGLLARQAADAGAENAMIRLLRDPDYAGETLSFGQQSATITVSGTNTKIIRSVGVFGNYTRIVRVTASYVNGILTPTEWIEVAQ